MARPKKIKRYKKVYRSSSFGRRASPITIALTIFVVIGLAVLGWGLYEPVYNLVMGNYSVKTGVDDPSQTSSSQSSTPVSEPSSTATLPQESSASSIAPSESSSQPLSSSSVPQTPESSAFPEPESSTAQPESSLPVESSTPAEPLAPVPQSTVQAFGKKQAYQTIKAVYMPENILLNANLRTNFLTGLAGTEVNSVLFDVKNSNGVVNYKSSVAAVAEAEALSPYAIDLAAFVAELEALGLRPVGRIHAFKDPLAASVLREAMVKYKGNDEWGWLDNSAELGGKPWLNPYSEVAWNYLLDIQHEVSTLGVKEIILDSVHFPVGFSLEFADYGEKSATVSRTQILKEFVENFKKSAKNDGTEILVYVPITSIIGVEQERYGGNPADFAGNSLAVGTMPSLFGNAFSSGDFMLEAPSKTPYETVDKALKEVAAKLGSKRVVAFVQHYTSSNIDPLYNKFYTAEDYAEELRALAENGVSSYILYNPQGSY